MKTSFEKEKRIICYVMVFLLGMVIGIIIVQRSSYIALQKQQAIIDSQQIIMDQQQGRLDLYERIFTAQSKHFEH